MVASTYQATSGAGAAGPVELMDQMKDLATIYDETGVIANKINVDSKVFQYQIAGRWRVLWRFHSVYATNQGLAD